MTPMEKVKERFPLAYSIGLPWGYDVIVPCDRRPSPGYKAHKCLGAGSTSRLAWLDAATRIMRRKWKRPSD